MQYLIEFCSRLETVSDVIFGTFVCGAGYPRDIRVKVRDPHLNCSREMSRKAVRRSSHKAKMALRWRVAYKSLQYFKFELDHHKFFWFQVLLN